MPKRILSMNRRTLRGRALVQHSLGPLPIIMGRAPTVRMTAVVGVAEAEVAVPVVA